MLTSATKRSNDVEAGSSVLSSSSPKRFAGAEVTSTSGISGSSKLRNDSGVSPMTAFFGSDQWKQWNGVSIAVDYDNCTDRSAREIFVVNDMIKVNARDLVHCVQFLVLHIQVERFSVNCSDLINSASVEALGDVVDFLSKNHDKCHLKEMLLRLPPGIQNFENIIGAHGSTLEYLSLPMEKPTLIDTIINCKKLKSLSILGSYGSVDADRLKQALASVISLESLSISVFFLSPGQILSAEHRLKHLELDDMMSQLSEIGKKACGTASQPSILTEIRCLVTHFFRYDLGYTVRLPMLLKLMPQLERFHVAGMDVRFTASPFRWGPGDASVVIRELAEWCLRTGRSLTFSCQFEMKPYKFVDSNSSPKDWEHSIDMSEDSQETLYRNMMMRYDRRMIKSLEFTYTVVAFDPRLHTFDSSLRPSMEQMADLLIIHSIDGKDQFRRVFRLELAANVNLCVAFGEQSPPPTHNNDNNGRSTAVVETTHTKWTRRNRRTKMMPMRSTALDVLLPSRFV